MLLAVVLQVVGALLVVAAVGFTFGLVAAVGLAGVVVFVAGYAHERAEASG